MTKYNTFLLELDSLLDTRLGLLSMILEDGVIDVMNNGFHSRRRDSFPPIPDKGFSRLYSMRDEEVLEESIVTGMGLFIPNFVEWAVKAKATEIEPSTPRILINTYPYSLSEEELERITIVVASLASGLAEVTTCRYSPQDLVPSLLRRLQVSVFCMYMWNDWFMMLQSEKPSTGKIMDHQSCPDVIMLAPRLILDSTTTDKAIKEIIRETGIHPFEAMEKLSAPWINLQFVDVKLFSSIIDLEALKEYKPGDMPDFKTKIDTGIDSEALHKLTAELYKKIFGTPIPSWEEVKDDEDDDTIADT